MDPHKNLKRTLVRYLIKELKEGRSYFTMAELLVVAPVPRGSNLKSHKESIKRWLSIRLIFKWKNEVLSHIFGGKETILNYGKVSYTPANEYSEEFFIAMIKLNIAKHTETAAETERYSAIVMPYITLILLEIKQVHIWEIREGVSKLRDRAVFNLFREAAAAWAAAKGCINFLETLNENFDFKPQGYIPREYKGRKDPIGIDKVELIPTPETAVIKVTTNGIQSIDIGLE